MNEMNHLDSSKIAFIVCTNNDEYMKECRMYIEALNVPEGIDINIIEVHEASSMASGYNEGMHSTDAKYKIYLHQDVFIINRDFIYDLLSVFKSDESIGMVGMVGTPYLYKNGTMWYGIRVGNYYRLEQFRKSGQVPKLIPLKNSLCEVEAIDGLLMATQYDLEWREDVFDKWDFYDVSQSFEFIRAGYRVVVPGSEKYWYIHDCGIINLDKYESEKIKFLKEYDEFMGIRKNDTFDETKQKTIQRIKECERMDSECMNMLISLIETVSD